MQQLIFKRYLKNIINTSIEIKADRTIYIHLIAREAHLHYVNCHQRRNSRNVLKISPSDYQCCKEPKQYLYHTSKEKKSDANYQSDKLIILLH